MFFDTFSDIAVWCQVCFRRYGEYGIQEYEWLWRHVEMTLFRLGRLQFEKTESLWEFEYKGRKTAVGDPVISIHIPEGQPLDPEACDMPFGFGSGGGVIFGVTGGVTEAVLRRLNPDH